MAEYRVNVTYLEDNTFLASENFTYFNVTKANLTATVIGENVTVKENASFIITVPDDFDGKVNITVDGKTYTRELINPVEIAKLLKGAKNATVLFFGASNYNDKVIENVIVDGKVFNGTVINGKALVNITGLSGGVKEAEIRFISTDNYTNYVNDTAKFVVNKAESTIVITNDTTTVIATVTANATGTVTFYVNGVERNVTINNGRAVWENVLVIGNNTVVAIYNGDVNFTSSRNSTNFTVGKAKSFVNVTAAETVYGNDVIIEVAVPLNQTGFVTITVNNKNHTSQIINGKALFNITGLTVKEYTVNVTYLEDDTFLSSVNSTKFNVTKAVMHANVTAQNVTVEDDVPFIIDNVTADFDGKVIIKVGDDSYYDNLVKAYVEITKFTAGTYTANVTFYGDNNYNDRNYTVKFTVFRVNPEINVTIEDVTYPDNASAVVNVSNNANGTVEIYEGTKLVGTGTITDGKATVELIRLSGGVHEVTVKFITSDDYNNNVSATAKFEVFKAASTVVITNSSRDVIVTVGPAGTTGNVTFYINGVKYEEVEIDANGKATVLDVLVIGNNTVVAIYNGDVNYTGSENNTNFTVGKAKSLVNVTVNETVYGNDIIIEVAVPLNQNGFVTINVNNKNYTAKVENGKAVFNVTGLKVAEYRVNVTYLEDNTFLAGENFTYFNVTKANLTATVIGENVTVKENASFIITVPDDFDGKVNITVDGKTYTRELINPVEIVKLLKGAKNATAVFYGASNYNDKVINNVVFNVEGVDPVIDVRINDTTYPDKAVAEINVTEMANGTVKVIVDGKVFNGTVKDGKALVDLTGLSGGVKEAEIRFTSTDNYTNDINDTSKFVVNKAESTIVITNDTTTVIATVTANATGTVTFYVNGVEHNVTVNNGVAVWENVLVIGNNTVVAIYNGDVNFTSSRNSTNFTVGKVKSLVNVTVNETVYGNDIIIEVAVPLNQTGFVTIRTIRITLLKSKTAEQYLT